MLRSNLALNWKWIEIQNKGKTKKILNLLAEESGIPFK